jgi:GT2 family glycosyltransferase
MISFASASVENAAAGENRTPPPKRRSPPWRWVTLWIRVQADALLFDPPRYLQGVAWRIRGLRVRSRNRIAALAGRSRWAYAFWIARKEPPIRANVERDHGGAVVEIRPIIDCNTAAEGIHETLASLPSGARPIVIGGPPLTGVVQIASVQELAEHVDGPHQWLCPIRCGDRLATGALDAYAATIAAADDLSLVYSDDDLLDHRGDRVDPHFKPDWNPELFEHHDFLTGASVLKARPDELQGLPEPNWPRALVERVVGSSAKPTHLRLVLHHRRERPQPVVPGKPAEIRLRREWPLVTVIIPTRNRVDLLRKCMAGVAQTRYPHLEVIVVDNESDDPEAIRFLSEVSDGGTKIVPVTGEFNFSRLNNVAVRCAHGEFLCFLNNDIEIPDPDWLCLLVRQAIRPDIGAVGARLLYPDGTVQHAGVFTGIGGGAAHAHRFVGEDDDGYFERARLPQRVSAVTGACLLVSREKFLAVDGFDEENFPVAFNDVDLCLKLNERGWQSFYEARATLIHHESKSRGSDSLKANRARFAEELAALKRKWRTDQRTDPYHHPHLSPFCEQFLIAV